MVILAPENGQRILLPPDPVPDPCFGVKATGSLVDTFRASLNAPFMSDMAKKGLQSWLDGQNAKAVTACRALLPSTTIGGTTGGTAGGAGANTPGGGTVPPVAIPKPPVVPPPPPIDKVPKIPPLPPLPPPPLPPSGVPSAGPGTASGGGGAAGGGVLLLIALALLASFGKRR